MYLEVFEYLVGSAAFKAAVGSDPVEAGSIPVHLRYVNSQRSDSPVKGRTG